MKNLFLALSAFLLTACSQVNSVTPFDNEQAAKVLQQNYTSQPTEQMVKLNLPNKNNWQKIDLSYENKGAPVILIPTNENVNNWSQSVRTKISAYINSPYITAKQVVQNDLNNARNHCQQATGNIIEESKNAIVYRLDFANCYDEKNQMQIGKAFNGKDAVYLVRYTALANQISSADIHAMSHAIQQAQLVADPRYIAMQRH